MKVGLLGDTHGDPDVVIASLDKFKTQGVDKILHVGDFGFWPGKPGQLFLYTVNAVLLNNDQTLYVTPGNHEDYTYLRTLFEREDGWHESKSRILVAPRGHRWEWEGVSFVSLGGAPSVDRNYRLRMQRSQGFPVWWKEEDITPEDMKRTVDGGYADVMIAHDAPFGVHQVEANIAGNPFGYTEQDLRYAYEGRLKMREVVDAVKPKIFFHGHYHFRVEDSLELVEHTTEIRGLASDGFPYSCGILDLPSLDFTFWGTDVRSP